MKKFLPLTCSLLILGAAAPLSAQSPTAPKTDREKLGYALGLDVVKGLKDQSVDFDPAFFSAAVKDSFSGGATAMTPEQGKQVISDFVAKMRAKQLAAMPPEQRAQIEAQMKAAQAQNDPAVASKNKADGTAFLTSNKAKAGVQTLPSGLQYKVLTEGKGASPKSTDTVSVKYAGTLIDGKQFDSSDKQPGGTVSFPVTGVIPGWTEALQKMKVGSKWQLFIPSDLAYGDAGRPPVIPPAATLLFDVELVKIGE